MPSFRLLLAPFVRLFALTALVATTANIAAQTGRTYTAADYARAERLMNYNVEPLAYHGVEKPAWLDAGRFLYRDRGPQGFTFMLVDPEHGTKGPAFDHAAIAAALTGKVRQVKQPLNPANLPIEDLDVSADSTTVHFRIGPDVFRCNIVGQVTCDRATDVFVGKEDVDYDVSPDGQRGAFIRDNNLWVRDRATGRETQLTKDGVLDFGYATDNAGWTHSNKPILVWSPDSKKIATFQQDQRSVGRMYLVSTTAGHPDLESWPYPLAGDAQVITVQPVVIDVNARKVVRLRMAPEPHRSSLCDDVSCEVGHGWDDVQWSADGKHIAIVSTSRDHKQEWLRLADAQTGEVRGVMTESVPTYFESSTGDRANWRYLSGSNEVLWFSQRDNWGQMYLYDAGTGKLKNQITHGEGNVKKVLAIDEKARVMYFVGEAKEAGWDPYFTALYRVNLDGSGLKLLTPEIANHDIAASDDGTLFVDVASTPTTPAKSAVRDREGKVVMSVADEDIAKLLASGWKPLEPITTKARDGKTYLYGFMFKPTDFDESKRYPIVEWVYPGPQVGSCGDTRRFTPAHRDMQSLAELGFVVVCVDGLGTPGRSKSFHDALFGNLADNTIPDQIAAVKQLAAKYPWIDGERVGIYGHSGGGAATGAAMFHFPDFFKVGISESGNHDNREYEDDWAEKWVGLLKKNPDGTTNYDSQANQNSANNLKGHLLLMHGTMDDNVPPNNTLLVIDALIRANKDFDLIMLPNKHHGYGDDTPYATRRRWDYFVRYLAGGEPPHEYQMTPYNQQQEALGKFDK
jgi:dipeptidyl-peptidase-4